MDIGNMLIVLFYIDFSFPTYHRSQASTKIPTFSSKLILTFKMLRFKRATNELCLSWYILINNSANTIDHAIYAQINKKEWVGLARFLLWTAKGFN